MREGVLEDSLEELILLGLPDYPALGLEEIEELVLEEVDLLLPEEFAEETPVLLAGIDELEGV